MLSCRIDPNRVGEQEAVESLSYLTDVLAGRIEFEQARRAAREGAASAERGGRIARPRVDEDVALGVGRHTDRFAEIEVVRQLQRIDGVVGDLGDVELRGGRHHRQNNRQRRELQCTCHDSTLTVSRHYRVDDGVIGLRRIFCARHAVISTTMSSSGLRQSIACTVLNSPSCFPGLPNLPITVPSSSIL